MQISNAQIQQVLQLHLHKISGPREKSRTKGSGGADELILSTKAADMQRIKQKVGEMPEFRSAAVQELKQRLEAGQYQASAEEVAESILSVAKENSAKGR